MLGRFEVIGEEGQPAVFRSRKVGCLLAFLCLNLGRPISNHTLKELLWPDSDGDRQSQSLRRAITDLRDALETNTSRGRLVHTESGSVALDEDAIDFDVHRFESLLTCPVDSEDYMVRAAEALALYAGPISAPLEDEWVYPYRRQYEEEYCAAVEQFCSSLIAHGQAAQAVRIANTALHVAPLREEPFVASIRAHTAAGNASMALRQFEALEQMLDDNFGQTPSERALEALESQSVTGVPVRRVEIPESGGAVPSESRFYVRREADEQFEAALDADEGVLIVFGPRQVGKTSLLAQMADYARDQGRQVAVTDFQSLSSSEVGRVVPLYHSLLHSLATQLDVDYQPSWNEWVGPNSNLNNLIADVLKRAPHRVVWAMDEVDRLFGADYSDDFFGLIRSWYNRRALDPAGPWRKLTIAISYATEAHLFIKDMSQSPFNVGVRVNLRDFTSAEVEDLARRYGDATREHVGDVYALTHGHPFLTRRALGYLDGGTGIGMLNQLADSDEGPFGDHLRRLKEAVHRDPETLAEVRRVLDGDDTGDPAVRRRLVSAGVLLETGPGSWTFRVPVYEAYLRRVLG
jgi:DNA-binding SARP family transcriptional activator